MWISIRTNRDTLQVHTQNLEKEIVMKNLFVITSVLFLSFFFSLQAFALERWLRVHNNSSASLCYVYISHVGTGSWRSSHIGSCIRPGYYQVIDPGWQQGYCKVDMKFVFADNTQVIEYDYNICEGEDFHLTD